MTHCRPIIPACRSAEMLGSALLTTTLSSMDMKRARQSVARMSWRRRASGAEGIDSNLTVLDGWTERGSH